VTTKRWIAAFAAIILLGLGRVAVTHRVFAPVADEPVHVAAGYQWWHGDVAWDIPHPPLARILEALPVVSRPTPGTTDFAGRGRMLLIEASGVTRLLARARLANLIFLLIALICTIRWGLRYSRGVALLAAAMLVSIPPILGHAGLATTDMAVAAMLPLSLLALDRWLRARTAANALLLGLAIAGGALAKFSFIVFFPVCALAILIARRPAIEASRSARGILIAASVAFVVVWAGYQFTFGPSKAWGNVRVPAPAFVDGLNVVKIHNELGHDAYLLGNVRRLGWWYYFPAVFFFKTPLPFQLLALAGMMIIVRRRREYLDLVLILVAVMLSVLPSTINIGIRHILPIYPPLCVVAAIGAAELWRRARAARVAVVALCAWLFIGVALAHPDYLAWFNEAAGGHPERIALDSNLEWGQDMLRLRRIVRERHIDKIYVLAINEIGLDGHDVYLEPSRPTRGWIAVGETQIHLDEYARAGGYDWLKRYQPVERVGKSIRLYHVVE
jgi:4-amino-4-deoxy-L-arabinose transferase-like glycosyltransferase